MPTETVTTPVVPETPKLLAVLHTKWVDSGSPKPDGKTAKTLVTAWQKAHAAKTAAEAALNAAIAEEVKATSALILARGKGRIKFPDGSQYIPMSKGDTVYLRREGGVDVETFGS